MSSDSAWGGPETKLFLELTPDRILDAVEVSGLRCTGRCLPLHCMENRVYEVEIESDDEPSRASDRFRIVKFYRPGRWTAAQIQEEHAMLLDLVVHEIPVVAPLSFDGRTLHLAEGLPIYYAVFRKVGGRSPDELDAGQLATVGRLLGRLHNVGALREAPSRLALTPEVYGERNLAHLLSTGALPPQLERRYRDIVEQICQLSAPLFSRAESQRIHGDCHLGNLLWGGEGAFLVDFDDMCRGPCVQDLWLLVGGRDADAQRRLELLLGGYEQMRKFDRRTLRLIEPLRALRYVHFASWIWRRWKDPAFPRTFPQFGTERYWAEQIEDLREQLELIAATSA